ncbi:MAG: G/U mismatch-specific DNA glycosylase [Acidiferrobacterales bacterium]
MRPWKPTKTQLLEAAGKGIPDLIAPDLKVLFVGINPSLYSAAVRHHFARPGNRFWPALHGAGFTDRLLSPFEERELLKHGYGITNVVRRATASASELSRSELTAGGRRLRAKVQRYRPRILALLGVDAYRAAFDRPKAVVGEQREKLGGNNIWVLPNPSGLNAHYQLGDLVQLFRKLGSAAQGAA